jgi:uncharacterized protein Yka (UPF0111/DUF47 family)
MTKQKWMDRLFPVKYDFYAMLSHQAQINSSGVDALYQWLAGASDQDGDILLQAVKEADSVRMDLEKNLIQAFSTPFDRGDIYTISVGMDKVIEYAKSTLLSMKAYDVQTNEIIIRMVGYLAAGAKIFAESIECLKLNPIKAESNIARIRETHTAIEQLYRDGMADVFKIDDPIEALKKREVYHHIKDASTNLEDTVDILHRIVVRLT